MVSASAGSVECHHFPAQGELRDRLKDKTVRSEIACWKGRLKEMKSCVRERSHKPGALVHEAVTGFERSLSTPLKDGYGMGTSVLIAVQLGHYTHNRAKEICSSSIHEKRSRRRSIEMVCRPVLFCS